LGPPSLEGPALETKTALKENATGFKAAVALRRYDRTEKICALDGGRADRC